GDLGLLLVEREVRVAAVLPRWPWLRRALGAQQPMLALLLLDGQEHVAQHRLAPFAQRHRGRLLAPLERDALAEDPGMAAGAAGDAGRVGAGLAQHAVRIRGGEEIARAPHLDVDRAL